MEALALVIFVCFAVMIAIIQVKIQKRKIIEQMLSMGCKVISIERKVFHTGPFVWVKRGRTVYKIRYKKDKEEKEGWVMFGDLSGPDWRL
jgi:hypothetical protein